MPGFDPLVDVPHPQDLNTAQKALADPATRASDALKANPSLRSDPAGLKAVLSQPHADGLTSGNTAAFLAAYGNAHKGVQQAAGSTNYHASNWFGGLWHKVASVWDGVRHQVASVLRGTLHEAENLPGQVRNFVEGTVPAFRGLGEQVWHDATVALPHYLNGLTGNYDQALANYQQKGVVGGLAANNQPYVDAGKALGTEAVKAGVRTAKTLAEVGSLGQVNSNFEADGNIGANLGDAVHTVTNALNQTVNPLTLYRNMAHTIAFTESLARRKGVAYALETMLPYFALAMVTHTALVGVGGVSGAIGVDAASGDSAAGEVVKLEDMVQSQGGTLTPAEEAAGQSAEKIIGGGEPAPLPQTPSLPARAVAKVAGVAEKAAPNIFPVASRIVGTLTKPLAPLAHIAHALAKPGNDLRLNAMYALAHGGLSQDPHLADLWNQTANGIPVDEQGKPLQGGVGGQIMDYLGLPKGAWSTLGGGAINLYSNYLGADPLGAMGKVIGATRGFNSVGGLVGKMFGGMGVRTADDVYRIGRQYIRGARMFDWMANHDAGAINETFPGVFLGEEGKKALNLLGAATTREGVMKIFADMATGEGYVLNQIPGMSFYQIAKASFKYGDRPFTVGESLAGTADQIHAEAADIEAQTGVKVWPPDSANYAVSQGPEAAAMRTRTIFATAMNKLFNSRESYFNESTGKMENAVMDVGSAGLGIAIGRQLREIGENEATIIGVQNALLKATPDEVNNIILHAYHDTVLRLTFANMKYSVLDQVKVQISKDIREQLLQMMGPDGAGEKGVMVNGPLGRQFSTVVKDGVEKNAAIGETHLGQLHFPRARDLKGYAKFVGEQVEQFSRAQDGMMGVDLHLSADALDAKARFANSTLEGLGQRLAGKDMTLPGATDAMKEGYAAKRAELVGEIHNALSEVPEGDTIGHNRAFSQMFDKVRQNLDVMRRIVNLVDEWQFSSKFLGNNSFEKQLQLEELNAKLPEGTFTSVADATPAAMAKLRGELSALEDTTAEMTARLRKDAITLNELKVRIGEREPTLTPTQRDALAKRIQDLRERNPRYRNNWQAFIDGVNYYQSKIFVPLALYSGGWAIRVGNNEMLVNAFREGGMKTFQTKLLTSYVKHDTGRAVFTSRMTGMLERHLNKNLFEGSFSDMVKRTDLTLSEKVASGTLRTAGGAILALRDAAGGALHGLEHNLIHWDARTERMFDRVVGAINEYAPGGLPMGVHSSGGILAEDAMRDHLLYGEDEGGKSVMSSVNANRTFASVNPEDRNYYRGVRGSLTRIHDDSYLLPSMRELSRQIPGLPPTLTQANVDQLLLDMTGPALQRIEASTPAELERFDRHFGRSLMALPDETVFSMLSPEEQLRVAAMSDAQRETFYNHYDMARTIAYHDLHTVLGTVGPDAFVIHRPLLEQAVTGAVQPLKEIRSFIDSLPRGTEPAHIVAEVTAHESATGIVNRLASAMNIPQEITNAGFHAVLGPMVNAYVRDPLYLGIFDDEMEKLQGMVDNNLISEELQKMRAHENAVVKMSKFVHNPQDRTMLESIMRAFAPFYFAQNQAWRRALRMGSIDPGAFEKYLRTSLAVTNFVSVKGQNGAAPVAIPGTQFMGAIGGMGSGLAPNQLGSLGFSLAASVGSVSSVIPTGSEAGLGVLESIVRPSWGPLVTTVLKEAEHYLGLSHKPWADRTIKAILGPIASNSSMMSELVPSTFFRNALNATEGLLNIPNSSYASAQIYTLNNAIDNKAAQFYDAAKASLVKAGVPEIVASKIAQATADKQMADFFNIATNYREVHAFMDQVHMAAVFMYTVKTALGMGSPLALSLQETFSKAPEFQKLLNEKNPDGTLKHTFADAATLFAERYPTHIYDLVAHSRSAGSDYPETTGAYNLIENNPYVVSTYPNGAAYLTARDGTYSPQAYALELSMGLRSRYTLTGGNSGFGGYFDALMVANGNDYYYNWLQPLYPDTPGHAGYDNYKALDLKAKQYGRFDNPTWYGNFVSGGGRWAAQAKAVEDMRMMLTDPNVPDSLFGGEQGKVMYSALMGAYQITATQYLTATTSTQKYSIETGWYNKMTALASNSKAVSPALSYFITSVLRNLPTAKEG